MTDETTARTAEAVRRMSSRQITDAQMEAYLAALAEYRTAADLLEIPLLMPGFTLDLAPAVLEIDPLDIMSTWAETLEADQSKMLDFAVGAVLFKIGARTITLGSDDLAAFIGDYRIERRTNAANDGWTVTLVPRDDPDQGKFDLVPSDFALAPGVFPSPDDYDQWLKEGQRLYAKTSGSEAGFEDWRKWSSYGKKYDGRACAEAWNGFAPGTWLTRPAFDPVKKWWPDEAQGPAAN